MYNNFLSFVNESKKENITTMEKFKTEFSGKTFLNGLYRIHSINNMKKWTVIVENAFPAAKGEISVFGYDWLGRQFAIYLSTQTILYFEPGTGEAFDTGLNFCDFHNKEIPKNHSTCLCSEYFREWYDANNHFILPYDKCVGYKIPLFLNGKDELDNLEISDMEVYWEIMTPLINL